MKISRDVKFIENSFEILNGTYEPDSMIDNILSNLEFPIIYSDSPVTPTSENTTPTSEDIIPNSEDTIPPSNSNPTSSSISTLQRIPSQEPLNPVQEHMHQNLPQNQ